MADVKVLLAGNWYWDIYEESLARGFKGHGCDVVPFNILENGAPSIDSLTARLRPSWALLALRNKFVEAVLRHRPDIVFVYRGIEILPSAYRLIKRERPNTKIVLYHNDNPYSGYWDIGRCRHYLRGHKEADVVAVYRPDNVECARRWGAGRVELLLSSFKRHLHKPVAVNKKYDVLFVGHYERDDREELLDALYHAGVSFQVFGERWNEVRKGYPWLRTHVGGALWGDDYVREMSASKIGLGFLSGRNKDVYTRRCFEIPACGCVLLAPRTEFLKGLFVEGVEAEFWSSAAEMVEKVKRILANDEKRVLMAEAGMKRVLTDGHDEYARARQVLEWFGLR